MTFGEYIEGMGRAKAKGIFVRPGVTRDIKEILSNVHGYKKDSLEAKFKHFGGHSSGLPKDLIKFFDVPILNASGNFASIQQMRESIPNLTHKEYESLRRLAITMWSQNTEADLPRFLSESGRYLTRGEVGIDGKVVNAKGVAAGNAPGQDGGIDLRKRGNIIRLAKAAMKAGIALPALLAWSGATYALDDDASEADYIDHILSNLDKYDDKTVGAWERQVRKALPEEWAQAVDSFEASAVEKLDDPNAWWNPQVGGDRGTVGLGTGLQTAAEFAKYWLTEYPGAAVASVTEVPETIWNWINPAKASVQADQGSVKQETPYHDFGQHALPANVVPVQNQGSPHTKYGGLVQPLWPTSASN